MSHRKVVRAESQDCDDASEAPALPNGVDEVPPHARPAGPRNRSIRRRSKEESGFWDSLQAPARAILTALKARPEGLGTQKLAEIVGVPPDRIKHAMRQINGAARHFGIPARIGDTERAYARGLTRTIYRINESLARELVRPE